MKTITYTCDHCGTESGPYSFGHYGSWITLVYHATVYPLENTQHGLLKDRVTQHFDTHACLTAWLAQHPIA